MSLAFPVAIFNEVCADVYWSLPRVKPYNWDAHIKATDNVMTRIRRGHYKSIVVMSSKDPDQFITEL